MSFIDDLPLEADWDPRPHERVWFRNRDTGDLGYLVRRDGKDVIRYDRPGGRLGEIVRPIGPDWIQEEGRKLLSEMQLIKLAYEADRELCRILGLHEVAKKEWLNLKEKERIEWMRGGPGAPPLRGELYMAIRGALDKVTG